jgi:hypothetical protein
VALAVVADLIRIVVDPEFLNKVCDRCVAAWDDYRRLNVA